MLRFDRKYFCWAQVLFGLEVLIARFAHDAIVRPFVGDALATALLYCLVRSGLATSGKIAALAVLGFSFLLEAGQYFHLLAHLGLAHSRLARIVLGSRFDWLDLLAYTTGLLLVLIIETGRAKPVTSR